jgi:hypothetical protein
MRSPPRWFFAPPEAVAAKALKAIYRNQGVVPVTRLDSFLWFINRLVRRLWDFASRARKKKAQKTRTSTAAEPFEVTTERPEPVNAR